MAEGNQILLINEDEVMARYIKEKLSSNGYSVFSGNSRDSLDIFKAHSFDVLMVNLEANNQDIVSIIKSIKIIDPDAIIIGLIDQITPLTSREFSKLGIYDFVSKPINIDKLLFLLKKGAELHSVMVAHRKFSQSFQEQNSSLQKQNTLLAKRIEESTKNLTRLYEDLRQTYMRTIKVLAHAIDARDHYTHSHSENVARYAVIIAEEMGFSANDIEILREASELHDLGKIGIADDILTKPASLTPEEWILMKHHPLTAAQILEPLTFLNNVVDIVRQHHEHYDGTGYPAGLQGEGILLGARILHLADAYETMRSARAYRKTPLSKEEAISEVKNHSGTQFDPKVVEAFLKVVDKLG